MNSILSLEQLKIPGEIVFEGFYDYESGWEFDMPIHVVKPVYRTCCGGNSGHIENIIEDLMISLDLDGEVKEEELSGFHLYDKGFRWPYISTTAMQHFYKARKGKARRGIKYWKAVVGIKSLTRLKDGTTELDWDILDSIGF